MGFLGRVWAHPSAFTRKGWFTTHPCRLSGQDIFVIPLLFF